VVAQRAINDYLRAMIGNFKAEAGGVLFEFFTQHTVKLHGFQVYANDDQKRIRFHMQVNHNGDFYITDPQACPPVFLALETDLSQAIMTYGSTIRTASDPRHGAQPTATQPA